MSRKVLTLLSAWLILATACGSDDPTPATTVASGETAVTSTGTGTRADGAGPADTTTNTSTDTADTTAPDIPGSSVAESTTMSTSSAGTAASTTPSYTGPVSPITGLPVDDPALLNRKLVAVKMDNHWNARPQSGVEQADSVIEVVVESGLTRFIALFHHSDADWVGPMRSARPTDWTLVRPLNGVLTISGGQPWITGRITANGVSLIGDLGPPLTARWRERAAPHNLYVNTYEARRVASERGLDQNPPAPLFDRGPFSAPQEAVANYVFFDWSDTVDVTWRWDGAKYVRSVKGEPHIWRTREGDETGQISADVLIVLMAERYTACPSGDGSCVPAWDTEGANRAIVFAEGRYAEGRWRRDEASDWFTIMDTEGEEIVVSPGRLWIMIYPETADLIW